MLLVQVLLSPRIGGAESLADALSSEWLREGVSSNVIYLDDGHQKSSRLNRIIRLRRKLKSIRPDAIVAHSALPNIYSRLASPRRVPVIAVMHSASDDFASPFSRIIERALRLRHPQVVAVSDGQASSYVRHFPDLGVPRVIPNGIREDLPTKSTYAPAPRVVITMARVTHQKDPQLWVDTARILAQTDPDMSLVWWGPVTADPDISALVAEQKRSESPGRFLGPTSYVPDELLGADIFFHPSAKEAHSVAILEAAAVGLPIVCSSDVAATIHGDLVSIMFDPRSASSAASALSEVAANWARYTSDRTEVSRYVRSRFGMARCAATYLGLVRSLLRVGSSQR